MDFHQLAASATSALVERLHQRQARSAVRQLHALRDALDAAAREIEAPPPDDESTTLVDLLTERLQAELTRVQEESEAAVAALREQLDAERAANTELAAALGGAERDAEGLQAALATVRDEATTARGEATALAAEAAVREEAHQAVIMRADAQLVEHQRERTRLTDELLAQREHAEKAAREAAEATAAAGSREAEMRSEIERTEAALAEVRREAGRIAAELQAEREHTSATAEEAARAAAAAAARDDEYRRTVAQLESALDETRQDAARLSEDLRALGERAEAAERDLALAVEARAESEAALGEAAATHDARVVQLESRLQEASHSEAQLVEDLAARELVFAGERDEARSTRESLDGLQREHRQMVSRVQMLEEDLAHAAQGGRTEREALTAQLETALARTQALEAELASARDQHSRLQIRLDEAARVEAALRVDLVGAGAGYDATAARVRALERDVAAVAQSARLDREALEGKVDVAVARAEALEAALWAERDARAQLESRLDEAARIEAGLRLELAGEGASHAGTDATIDALRAHVDRLSALLDLAARGTTELAAADTSADLLSSLVKRLAIQFTRVALFRIKGDAFELEQQIALEAASTPAARMVPLAADTLLGRAVRAGQVESLSGADVLPRTGLGFGGTPTSAAALPLILHGTPIAVVYADDDGDSRERAGTPAAHQSAVAFAQLLTGHVVALLVRHTQELKTLAELRQYAATLLQESREMYHADVEAGRSSDALRSRLRENIDCASQLYAYRAAMEGTAAATLFDEQIAEEAAADSPFARDLADLLAHEGAIEIGNP